MTIGERISAVIEDKDLKISEIAKKMGVNRRQLTRWQKDEAEMGINKLKLFCEITQVSADYLLGLNTRECVDAE